MTLISIDDPDSPADESNPRLEFSRLALSPSQMTAISKPSDSKTVALPELNEDNDDSESNESNVADDVSGQSLIFGRYIGQVTARISRAWVRPRTPIGAAAFECRVQIEQDHSGNVKEVTLQRCNGDSRWQLSLVRAIQSASPLPAPPDPAVFAYSLRLQLTAEPFAVGHTTDGFEMVSISDSKNP